MRHISILAVAGGLVAVPAALAQPERKPITYVYSNEEQVYFAKEAGKLAPPLIYVKIEKQSDGSGRAVISQIDAFGAPASPSDAVANGDAHLFQGATRFDPVNFSLQAEGGPRLELRRARPATCWVAIKKDTPKADGSPDWFFAQGVKLHDQGGRALVGAGIADTQPVVIRMRNVIWPPKADGSPSSNKPSLVLYIHKPDKPDSAESYAWADSSAARIGVNLRWMQASCGIDGMENPSAVTATNFRG